MSIESNSFESNENLVSGDVLFALEIDGVDIESGTYENHLPLHCTILRWTRVDNLSLKDLLNKLKDIISGFNAIKLDLTEEALFGEDDVVEVVKVDKNQQLDKLHKDLLNMMTQSFRGVIQSPQWSDDGYNPHITKVGDSDINPGQSMLATKLFVVLKTKNGNKIKKSVISKIDLK